MNKILSYLQNSWLLLPAIVFYYQVNQHLQNIPVMDDYDIILKFLLNFKHASTWGRLALVFSQYGEHRLVPSKLFYLAYYYLTGGVNFRVIGLIGDLQLLPVGLIGIYFIRRLDVKYWQIPALIWMLLVFDLNTYENAMMPMYGVSNYGVVCYFFCSLFFYSRSRRWIPLAILFQAMCIFSNGNGLAGGLILAAYAWAVGDIAKLIAAGNTFLVFTSLYFINYHTVTLPGKLPFSFERMATFFVRQAGAPFSFNNSAFCGLLLIGVCIWAFTWRSLKESRFAGLLCIFVFSDSTMVLTALFRSGYADAQFQTSRYLIYPQMIIGILAAIIYCKSNGWKNKWLVNIVLLAILISTYFSNFEFGRLGFERTEARAMTRRFWHPQPASAGSISRAACAEGIYCIDDNR